MHALSAIDVALWDIKGKASKLRCISCSVRTIGDE